MSNSSQQDDSLKDLIISSSDTIDLSGITTSSMEYKYDYHGQYDTITLTGLAAQPALTTTSGTYTIGSLSTDQIAQLTTITLDSSTTYNWNAPQEWVDSFPNWTRVQDMMDKYPGLKIAYDNFRVFYEMVKDDYDNPIPKK